jgi:hypothetical protein
MPVDVRAVRPAPRVVQLLLLGFAASVCADPAPIAPPGIAVLTPGVPASLQVTTLELLSEVTGVSTSAGTQSAMLFTSYAMRDGFDAAERFSSQLLSVLRAQGRDAIAVKVSRPTRGPPRPLERGDLPEVEDGRVMLDVQFAFIALAAISEFSAYKPAMGLTYRVVGANGQLIQGSRALTYREGTTKFLPGWFAKPGSFSGATSMTSEKLVEFNNDPACSWKTFNQVKDSTARVWVCFDDAFVRLAEGLVAGLP